MELGFPSVIQQYRSKGRARQAASTISDPAQPEAIDNTAKDAVPEAADGSGGGGDGGGGVYLEIGAGDGSECNTRLLREAGWKGLTFDSGHENPEINLYKAFVTAEAADDIIAAAEQRADLRVRTRHLDVLSIDIDGMDFYIWASIGSTLRPKVVIIEYNSMLAAPADQVQPHGPLSAEAAPAGSVRFGAGGGGRCRRLGFGWATPSSTQRRGG